MPNIENEQTKLHKSTVYATFDFSHGYCQLPLHRGLQGTQNFINPNGVFTTTRVLYGTTNAALYLEYNFTSIIPGTFQPSFLIWLDDPLVYCAAAPKLLKIIDQFSTVCVDYNIKLHSFKNILFTEEIGKCGRLISAVGTKFDPCRMSDLICMTLAQTGSALQQFFRALQWVRTVISEINKLMIPLNDLLESIFVIAGAHTKRATRRVLLTDHR